MSLIRYLLIISALLCCTNANSTVIEVLNDHLQLTSQVWFDGYPGSSPLDAYSGPVFGKDVEVYSSFTVDSPDEPGEFTTYHVGAGSDHTRSSTGWIHICDMWWADYGPAGPLSGSGTARADLSWILEFNVIGAGSKLEIDGYPTYCWGCADYSLSLFDKTLDAVVIGDSLGRTAGTGLFNLTDSHTYRLDYSVNMLAHGDPDPGPDRYAYFMDVDYVTYVPEPSALLIFGAGLIGVAGIKLRQKG